MKMKKLGHTDIEVSELCIGTMTFGEQNTQADCDEQLDFSLERGINFLDTAEMYAVPTKAETCGKTEEMVGNWLKSRGNREKVVLATKVTGRSDAGFAWIRNHPRPDRENIMQAIEGSLSRLQTDYIDLYQIHWPDRKTNTFGQLGYEHDFDDVPVEVEETLRACETLVESGKVRHIGLSNETPWGVMHYLQLAERYNLPRVVSIQNPYNLLNRTYEVGLAEISIRENVGLMCYAILACGVLSGKYLGGQKPAGARGTLWPEYFERYFSKGSLDATEKYCNLAKAHGISPSTMAVAWGLRQPFMLSIILGATKLPQLEEQIAATELALSDELLLEIEKIHNQLPNPYLVQ